MWTRKTFISISAIKLTDINALCVHADDGFVSKK